MSEKKSDSKPVVQIKPIDEIKSILRNPASIEQFKKNLPAHVDADKFISVILTAIQNNPQLLEADRQSFYNACTKASLDGLLPDGREAAFVVYGMKDGTKKVQYMPMVGGILKKVRNSGELLNLTAQVVYESDEFDYWSDENGEHVKHRPFLTGERGNPKLTFAIAKTKDGGIYFEFVTEDQMAAVVNISKAKNSGPWAGPFADEMRRKTAIRRLSKRLPMSTDLEQTIRSDDDFYDLEKTEGRGLLTNETKSPSRLSEIVTSQAEPSDTPNQNSETQKQSEPNVELPSAEELFSK